MSWRDFFKSTKAAQLSSPRVEQLRSRLLLYLTRKEQEDPGREYRVPLVAQALKENELVTLAGFYLLRQQGVVDAHYGVYCAADQHPIETYDRLDEVRDDLPCDTCGTDHSVPAGTMRVELFFTANNNLLYAVANKAA